MTARQALSAADDCQGATKRRSGTTSAVGQLLQWAAGRFDEAHAVLTPDDAQHIANMMLPLAPHQETKALLAVSGLVFRWQGLTQMTLLLR